jgi:3',5'-cyclic AMP phosphodiesterase CpdA
MRLHKIAAALLLLGALGPVPTRGATGVVFDDRNGDGIRGAGEPGISGVEVSNGVDVVSTDAAGRYLLPDRPGHSVFLVKPRGWKTQLDALNRPRFYAAGSADFPLTPSGEPDALRVLVLTDTQPATPTEVGYLERGVAARIGRRSDVSLGVTLGDLVYDRPDLFDGVSGALARIGVPWYSLPGNHDIQLGESGDSGPVAAYERTYGPSTYAFHAGPALFIALDDVRPQGGPRYIGGLTPDQFSFLSGVLSGSPSSEWVVLMFHIPLFAPDPTGVEGFRPADKARLFSMLKGRARVLVLSGHTHYQRHVFHGAADGWEGPKPIEEYNVAAACGGFWGGPKDADGIPVSTMWDGTPPGYAIATFHGDSVSLDYFPARLPAESQLSVHAPKSVAPKQGYVSFYANVYNGHDGWTVEACVDDRVWNPMRRTLGWDPTYAESYLSQDSASRPLPGPRLPDPAVCYHLWKGSLPADLPLGSHTLHVRATSPQGIAYVSDSTFEIAAP